MARIFGSALLLPLLLCGAAPSAFAAALSAETKIDAVTIYPDAAIVTRIGALDLPDGEFDRALFRAADESRSRVAARRGDRRNPG